jgi:hypothetical protein
MNEFSILRHNSNYRELQHGINYAKKYNFFFLIIIKICYNYLLYAIRTQ